MKLNLQKNNIYYVMMLVSLLFISLFSFQGCNRSEQHQNVVPTSSIPSTAEKQQIKAVQKPVSSSLKLASPPVNQFDFSSKKDPFKPYAVMKSTSLLSKSKPNDSKPVLPIHSFDVSQFKLIGIITGGKENQAMVTDPNGKGYVLKTGMTIGKNDGKIVSVTNGGVDILEQFRDDNGRVRKENIKITLPRKQ
jgi:type IV pilus assembly protein PilP